MCKSALYAADTTQQATIEDGSVISFGSIIRRFGKNISLSNGIVHINGEGYYEVLANITFTAVGAGPVTIRMYKDGVAISGAVATITATAPDLIPVVVPALIRSKCCDGNSTITVTISGAITMISNAAIVVKKI